MGYSDADVSICIDVLGPLYIVPGPILVASTYLQCGIHRLRVCPSMQLGPPTSPICYTLGIHLVHQAPKGEGFSWCIWLLLLMCNWCATSLVWGTLRVAVAVQRLTQHSTPHSTAQHPCALQHNATIGITHIPSIVLSALGGELGQNNFGVILVRISS